MVTKTGNLMAGSSDDPEFKNLQAKGLELARDIEARYGPAAAVSVQVLFNVAELVETVNTAIKIGMSGKMTEEYAELLSDIAGRIAHSMSVDMIHSLAKLPVEAMVAVTAAVLKLRDEKQAAAEAMKAAAETKH